MTLSIYLATFCPNCSWWLIPLLLGAWFLGWLFYHWTKGSRLKTENQGLHGDIKNWKTKYTGVESDFKQAKYDKEKLSGEYATIKSKLVDSDGRYKALETKYNNMEVTGGVGGGEVDVTQWTDQISELESQLEVSRNTNLKLQGDYATLKSNFSDMQNQLEAGAIAGAVVGAGGNGNDGGDAQVLDEYLSRIGDLERKLALSYENNTKMEADYAHLKANMGELEMNLHSAGEVDNSGEIEGYQIRIAELEKELASRAAADESAPGEGKKKKKKKKKSKKKKNKNKKKKKGGKGKKEKEVEPTETPTSGGMSSGYALVFVDDNLQIIEGVGPKIEGVLQGEGIGNWKDLSQTSTTRLREVLEGAGSRYKMHDPSTWAQQAELAQQGDWEKLVALQKFLGTTDGKETDSKAEKMYFKAIGFANVKKDDLKVIEGIGPKIEGLLKDGGIPTWKKLSESEVEEIQKILDDAGPRYKLANPGTWAKQAKLADDGNWSDLKIYQDNLKGGIE